MSIRRVVWGIIGLLGVAATAMAVLGVATSSPCAAADKPVTSTLRTRVSRVAVFKNGHGLFFREGQARPLDGWLHADYLPYASLGTVWVYTTGDSDLVEMVISAKQTELSFADSTGLEKLLRERVGSRVVLVTIEGKRFEGELTAVAERMAMLEGNGSLISVRLDTIKSATLVDLPVRIKVATDKQVEVVMTYLERGIRWLPSYVICRLNDEEAELRLRAILVNDAEDLEDSAVYFVVGVPSFTYQEELDPLVLNRVAPAIKERFQLSGLRSQAAVAAEAPRAPGARPPDVIVPRELPSLPGEDVGELFMYEAAGVTLKVGEVGMLTIFSETVPYRTVYEWNADSEDVWECVELSNTTEMPWTTAPAAIYSDWRMIGQDTLKYTPVRANKKVNVTITRNIGTSHREQEIDRETAALKREDQVWDLVTLSATLEITNYQNQTVEITITKSVTGELVEMIGTPSVSRPTELVKPLNPSSVLRWTISVEPGETKTLGYTYKLYVR